MSFLCSSCLERVLGIGYWVLGIGYNYELQYLVGFIMCVEERRSPEKYHEA